MAAFCLGLFKTNKKIFRSRNRCLPFISLFKPQCTQYALVTLLFYYVKPQDDFTVLVKWRKSWIIFICIRERNFSFRGKCIRQSKCEIKYQKCMRTRWFWCKNITNYCNHISFPENNYETINPNTNHKIQIWHAAILLLLDISTSPELNFRPTRTHKPGENSMLNCIAINTQSLKSHSINGQKTNNPARF